MIKTIEDVLKHNIKGLKGSLSFERNHLGLNAEDYARLLGYKQELSIISPSEKRTIFVENKAFSEQEFEEKFQIQYLSFLRFNNPNFLNKTLNNFPYFYRLFEKTFSDKSALLFTTINWIDKTLGYGLFAREEISQGTVIGEYTGFVRRYYRRTPDTNGYCFKYPTKLWGLSYTLIDAEKGGNETRFINHSQKPNLKPELLFHGNLIRTVFVASRPINKGEELTFDYGDDYWRKRLQIS